MYTFSEPYDVSAVTPSVLNVIHGQIVPMDLVKVETEKERFFSFLSVGWGLMADIDIESERLRAIGEARFAVWGVIRALGKYEFVLKYTLIYFYITMLFTFCDFLKIFLNFFVTLNYEINTNTDSYQNIGQWKHFQF